MAAQDAKPVVGMYDFVSDKEGTLVFCFCFRNKVLIEIDIIFSLNIGHLPFKTDDVIISFEEQKVLICLSILFVPLIFKKNQKQGWMRGYLGSRWGRFPANYVREQTPEERNEEELVAGVQDNHNTHYNNNNNNNNNANEDDDDDDDDVDLGDTAIFRPGGDETPRRVASTTTTEDST